MNGKRILFVMLALLVTLSAGATWVAAQTVNSGAVSGTVTDPSGAVVPGATVTLKSTTQGTTFQATTNSSGVYSFALLTPGHYTMTVEATGFEKTTAEMDVSVSQTATGNVALKVAAAGTTVTVTEAAAPLTQTQNGDVTTALSHLQVSQVPNPGNDLSYVAQMAPGTVMNTSGGYGNFSSYGLPGTSNLFTLNGMDDNDPFLNLNNSGATNLLLGQNEVQEATVVNNGYSGQFGGLAGANVNYITKSGGNQFHGNAIYYWNGAALNATSYFLNATDTPKAFDNANQWAGSIGGPIKKDKFFFFFNTEGLRVLLPTATPVNVPSAAFQTDVLNQLVAIGLTDASTNFYNTMFNFYNTAPGVGRAVPGQFGDNSTVAQGLNENSCTSPLTDVAYGSPLDENGTSRYGDPGRFVTPFPGDPNLGVTEPCVNNFTSNVTGFTHEWQMATRADWNIGAKDQAFIRFQYDTGVQATYTDPINSLFNAVSTQPEYQGQILETHSFGPTASNQLLFAGSWYTALFGPSSLDATLAAFPTNVIMLDGTLANMGGIGFDFPQGRNVTQAQVQDDVSKTIGAHTIKFGGKWRRNWISVHDFGVRTNGEELPFTLQDFANGGFDPNFGAGDENIQQFPTSLVQPIAEYSLQIYGQDEWRIKPNLTVTVALRAEHFSNPTCLHLCFATLPTSFPSAAASDTITQTYTDSLQTNRKQAALGLQSVVWEPRVSFAWQPFSGSTNFWTSNVVIRGGFGIFGDQFPGQVADLSAQNPPYDAQFRPFFNNIAPTETAMPYGNDFGAITGSLFGDAAAYNQAFQNGFATGQTLAEIEANIPFFRKPSVAAYDPSNSVPTYEKWSLGIQKGFGANTLLSVSYIGNHGYHETIANNSINAWNGFNSDFVGLPTAPPDLLYRGVNWITSGGVSNYNGLTTTFQHRFSSSSWGSGVVQFNYTWSHAMDEISNGGFGPFTFNSAGVAETIVPQNPYNFRASYGPADYDIRNYANVNYVWELPIKKLFGGHGSDYITNGWQVSGAVFARTGLPYTVYDGALSAGTLAGFGYNGNLVPQFVGGPHASCGSGAAFTNPSNPCVTSAQFPAPGSELGFSSGLRNAFRAPGYWDTDFTVMKNTKIPGWERGQLGLGFQFFNLFNHPNFSVPDSDTSSSTFGQILTTASTPTSILGSFLGADASPRLIQLKAQLTF